MRSGVKLLVKAIVVGEFSIQDIRGLYREFPWTIPFLVIQCRIQKGIGIVYRVTVVGVVVVVPGGVQRKMLEEINVHIGIGPLGVKGLFQTTIIVLVYGKSIAYFKIGPVSEIRPGTTAVRLGETLALPDLVVYKVIRLVQGKVSIEIELNLFYGFAETEEGGKGLIGEIAVDIDDTTYAVNTYDLGIVLESFDPSVVVQRTTDISIVKEIKTEIGQRVLM